MSTRLGLRAFPPEIIEIIFTPLLEWNGKTPALLLALRGDEQLYQEALALFNRLNTFTLHRGNEWKTRDMGLPALQNIRSLTVDFWSSEDWEEWDNCQIIEPSTHAFSSHSILLPSSSVRSLHLNVTALSEFNMKACLIPAVACAETFPLLQEISVALPRISYRRCIDEYDISGLVSDTVDDFNFYLGCTGRLRRVGAGVEEGEMMVWFWKAEGLGECVREAKREWERLPKGLRGRDAACWTDVS